MQKLPGFQCTGELRLPGFQCTGELRLPGFQCTREWQLPGTLETGESFYCLCEPSGPLIQNTV